MNLIQTIHAVFDGTMICGIAVVIWRQGANQVKLDTMWEWFTNHGSNITGYKPKEK